MSFPHKAVVCFHPLEALVVIVLYSGTCGAFAFIAVEMRISPNCFDGFCTFMNFFSRNDTGDPEGDIELFRRFSCTGAGIRRL